MKLLLLVFAYPVDLVLSMLQLFSAGPHIPLALSPGPLLSFPVPFWVHQRRPLEGGKGRTPVPLGQYWERCAARPSRARHLTRS